MWQIHECVEIEMCGAKIVLNSKIECYGSLLPRVTVEVRDRVSQLDYNGVQLDSFPNTTHKSTEAKKRNVPEKEESDSKRRNIEEEDENVI